MIAATSGPATRASCTYDPNGNLTSKSEGTDNWAYTWNAENKLTTVEKTGAEVARFAYDPIGRRVEKVAGVVTTSYTYDDLDVLRESNGTTTLKYVDGPGNDEILAVDDGAASSYFHQDGLGSVVSVTSAAGAAVLTRAYDAWGRLQLGASNGGYAFTGREWDPETGLSYYRARYYDPAIGRFISEDPIGFRADQNFYVYVGSDPTSRRDPRGLDWKSKAWKAAKWTAGAAITAVGIKAAYDWVCSTIECRKKADEACAKYKVPHYVQSPLDGSAYDENYMKYNQCHDWAMKCCSTKAATEGANNLINEKNPTPIDVKIIPETTCDFSNPPF